MAHMRRMGSAEVDYHKQTVLERGDDYPGLALEYYGSRGETPLRWGGTGAARLGLSGAVTEGSYENLYGPGGARDPESGARLVSTARPGMELVMSAQKSVAELGVIGRADDMHAIMDAERDATLAYLPDHKPLDAGPGPVGLGAYHQAAMALVEGVDLLVHDAQHTAAELPRLARVVLIDGAPGEAGKDVRDWVMTLSELEAAGAAHLERDPRAVDDAVELPVHMSHVWRSSKPARRSGTGSVIAPLPAQPADAKRRARQARGPPRPRSPRPAARKADRRTGT